MMSKILFNNNPFLLGFNHLEDEIDKVYKAHDNYPPYNIEEYKDGNIVISIAVAGFSEEELKILLEGNKLTIIGHKNEIEDSDKIYIHKGIANRKFSKTFLLAEGVEPSKSYLDKGILTIKLIKNTEKKEVKIINISKK